MIKVSEDVQKPAAFLDLWREKIFLGREFLTWLWITSEIHGNLLKIEPQGEVELWFEKSLTLESGAGTGRKTVICRDPESKWAGSKWAEAAAALREGKQITRGRLKLITEDKEWGLTLNADTLTPQAVSFPKGPGEAEDRDFLERAALLKGLLALIDSLCRRFLELRLSEAWAAEELPRLNQWISSSRK
jgi:hypothetical protein